MVNTAQRIWALMAMFGCGMFTAGCFAASSPQAKFKETKTITAPHEATAAIRVKSGNGGISVQKAGVTEAKIVAQFACISEERLAECRIVAERKDGVLVVEARFPGGRHQNNESCDIDITLPGATGVTLESSNGRLKMGGLAGTARLQTNNGEIRVDGQDGPVTAKLDNGAIEIIGAKGEVEASARNGEVHVVGAAAAVNASSSNGSVTVKLIDGNNGPAKIRSDNGAVKLVLGKSFTGRIDCSTSMGSIKITGVGNAKQSEIKKQSGFVIIGDDKTVSELRTNLGSVEVQGAE